MRVLALTYVDSILLLRSVCASRILRCDVNHWKSQYLSNPRRYDPLVAISKDPLAHISDRENTHSTLLEGGRVGITHDISTVFDDIQILSPNEISATPRFWNVIYSEFKRAFDLGQEKLAYVLRG